ncbi:hypothetical protein PMAYCL1PPCAC_16217, partial [Pristionchus mayeri]
MLNIAASCGSLVSIGSVGTYFHFTYIHDDKTLSAVGGEVFGFLHTISVPITLAIFVFSQPKLRREYQIQLRRRFRWIP